MIFRIASARAYICIRYRRMDDNRVILLVSGTRTVVVGRYQTSESNKFRYSNRIRVVGAVRPRFSPGTAAPRRVIYEHGRRSLAPLATAAYNKAPRPPEIPARKTHCARDTVRPA